MESEDKRIDANTWYSDWDVVRMLSITHLAQEEVRKAGQLRSVRRGNTYFYKGQWLLDFLETEPTSDAKPKTASRPFPRKQSTPAAVSPAKSSPKPASTPPAQTSPSTERTSTVTDQQTIETWNKAIRGQMQTGKTRSEAVRIVAKANPQLHRAYLIACNRHKASAVEQLA